MVGRVDPLHHAAGDAAVCVDDTGLRHGSPREARRDAPLPLCGFVVIENSGLRIEQMRRDWRFTPRQAVPDATARVFDVGFDVTRIRRFYDDEFHLFRRRPVTGCRAVRLFQNTDFFQRIGRDLRGIAVSIFCNGLECADHDFDVACTRLEFTR